MDTLGQLGACFCKEQKDCREAICGLQNHMEIGIKMLADKGSLVQLYTFGNLCHVVCHWGGLGLSCTVTSSGRFPMATELDSG